MFYNLFPVFIKELRSYFQSKMIWFVFIVYELLTVALTFFQSSFLNDYDASMMSFFKIQQNLFLSIIPALTIKLWSDEKRIGTLELTLSLPISCLAIVVGKFLAVWCLCGLMLVTTLGMWFFSSLLIPLNSLLILQNYVVLWLICGSLAAISLVASSFTSHSVSAFVVSLAACLVVALPNYSFLFQQSATSSEILLRIGDSISFNSHFMDMISGQINISSLVYFISIIVSALFLNSLVICRRRR